MTPRPDFDFGFGKDRYLRGYGWRGLMALALLLVGVLVGASLGAPLMRLLHL
ncbi:hypothetical protein [Methylobacterium sp. 22177]|uniref:hypothetical protein n=1 Tax=Methylobacterium sp. 22177 TaxID=3453885 RepID=UPI003F83A198